MNTAADRPEHTAPQTDGETAPPLDLSIVIPVYRSAQTLRPLTERLVSTLKRMGLSHEIVFVDDGSADESWSVLQALQQLYPQQIVCIRLMRNFGQHNALMCGFRHTRGRYIVTMDDDLQNPPEEIPRLFDAIGTSNHDLIYGAYESKQHARLRNLSSWLVNSFFRTVFGLSVTVTSFRIIRRALLDTILDYSPNFAYIDGLFAWNTRRIGSTLVQHHARPTGRSGYSVAKLFKLAFNLFTNFSLLPLQFVSGLGFVCAAGGFILGTFYLLLYFLGQIKEPGFASIIIAVFVLGGVQLLSLGMIGEYVGRMHLNVSRMPQYTIREVRRAASAATAVGAEGTS